MLQAVMYAATFCLDNDSVAPFIAYCRAEARALLTRYQTHLDAVAKALLKLKSSTGDAIDAVIAATEGEIAAAVERERRQQWRATVRSAADFEREHNS